MEWVNIATFNESRPAEVLVGRLNKQGIPARVYDESAVQKWFRAEALASIRLQVDRHHYAEARRLLAEWHAGDGALDAASHCPECGSAEVEYPQFTRKFILPSVGIFLSTLGFVEKKFYCQHCHYTWPVKEQVPVSKDLLGWPKR